MCSTHQNIEAIVVTLQLSCYGGTRLQWETGNEPQMGWFRVGIRPSMREAGARQHPTAHLCFPKNHLDQVFSISGDTELSGKLRPREGKRLAQDHQRGNGMGKPMSQVCCSGPDVFPAQWLLLQDPVLPGISPLALSPKEVNPPGTATSHSGPSQPAEKRGPSWARKEALVHFAHLHTAPVSTPARVLSLGFL